jgi:hypothetical protein
VPAFIIQSVVLCLLFTLIVVTRTVRDPLGSIMNYPPAIQERVAGLPQYQDRVAKGVRRGVGVKAGAAVAIVALLALVLIGRRDNQAREPRPEHRKIGSCCTWTHRAYRPPC